MKQIGIILHYTAAGPMVPPIAINAWHRNRRWAIEVPLAKVPLWLGAAIEKAKKAKAKTVTVSIGYHRYITGDGVVHRARPIGMVGAHCPQPFEEGGPSCNRCTIGIAVGLCRGHMFPIQRAVLLDELVAQCVEHGIVPSRTTIKGHCEIEGTATQCPGTILKDLDEIVQEVQALMPAPEPRWEGRLEESSELEEEVEE